MSRDEHPTDNWSGLRLPLIATLAVVLLGGVAYFFWSVGVERALEAEQRAVEQERVIADEQAARQARDAAARGLAREAKNQRP